MAKANHDSEIPLKGQQVITACAFIYKILDNKVLLFLPKRATTKRFLPNKFELPGGHLNFGETLENGLKREIKEEFDMEIEVGKCFYAFTYVNEIKGSHSVEVIFYSQFVGPEENIILHPEDHAMYKWIDFEEYKLLLNELEQDNEYFAVIEGFKGLVV